MYPLLLELLGRRLREAGLWMMVWNADETEGEFELEAVRQGMVDGMIFTSATSDSTHLSEALAGQVPVVLINREIEGWPGDQVISDNRAGAEKVADYFLGNGRKRIGILTGPLQPSTIRIREAGFCDALTKAGITDVPKARAEAYTYDHAFAATTRMLSEAEQPLDALFCANDVLAFGALDAVRASGLRIPEDIWIVGFDDVPMAAWRAFDLTTVKQPFVDMCDRAVNLLLQRLGGDQDSPMVSHLSVELVLRGTSG
jgi:LacI family transcriptional regulator